MLLWLKKNARKYKYVYPYVKLVPAAFILFLSSGDSQNFLSIGFRNIEMIMCSWMNGLKMISIPSSFFYQITNKPYSVMDLFMSLCFSHTVCPFTLS